MPDKKEKHTIKEGSRKHVLHYDNKGVHCSEHNCEINKKDYTKEAATALCSIWIPIGSIVNGVRNGRECDVYIEGNNRAVRLSRVVVADLLEKIDKLKKDNLALATRRLRVVEEKFEDKK